ncbi:class I SAM-dependent methyltransferase [Paenibacillus thailandensis]|uniref:Class I SAM-dependent methyltransferase n=1 Tax=Paenibacillus thailandensis TaxID=393250 RepID=A0ABW5QZB0_9BACL
MSAQKHYEQIGVAMTCRSYEEYVRMFDLQEEELSAGPILDIAAGGSSFTAEVAAWGEAYAADPRYGNKLDDWVREAAEEIEVSTSKLEQLTDVYDWSYYGDPVRHRERRLRSLAEFEAHIRSRDGRSRYVEGSLPQLPFEAGRFSLVLCSHFLFLYSEQFDERFHIESVLEMMRLCRPGGFVKIYPIVSFRTEPYPGMEKLLKTIIQAGGKPEFMLSRLPFIPGSLHYLRIAI